MKITTVILCVVMGSLLPGQTSVLTQHNDLSRTGQNLNETILTPASVSSGNFGEVFSLAVDGAVLAQPLYMPALTINGASHNVAFIATEHDSVFAFDADTGGTALWQASLLDSRHGASLGATSVPDSQSTCYITNHEYGITSTPVIDPGTGTLYVVSDTLENNYPVYRLHALDVTTGGEKFGGPVVISASVPAAGVGSSNGILNFDPNIQGQRAGLALVNGAIYIAFGSLCDFGSYHGWLFAYDAAALTQTSVFLPTPNGIGSGLWAAGAAPAADTMNGVNRMFLATGNGTYSATTPYATNTMDYGDDVLRLDLSNGIHVADAFTPLNQAALNVVDADVGSSGPMLLPDQPGNHPHLLVQQSKGGSLYLIDRDNMGGYSTSANNVVQELDNLAGGFYGLPAYWNGNVYLWPPDLALEQFSLTNGLLSPIPVAVSTYQQHGGLGSTPSISASGNTNGIVWSVDPSQATQVLYAHDATNVANMLWNSAISPMRDSAGQKLGFVVPTIANGRVYVGSVGQVAVYGILNLPQTITFGPIATQVAGPTLNPGATASSGLTVTYSSSTPSVCTASGSVVTLVAAGTCTISALQTGNASYAAATPVSQSFTVTSQSAPPPYVGYVACWGINNTGATITWSTDAIATTQLSYGTTTALGSLSPLQATLSFSHGVTLSALNPGTTYYFVAQSMASGGSTGYSTMYSFKTTGTATTPPPVVSGVAAINISNTSATITWTTDQASSSQVNYGTTSAYGSASTLNTSLVTSHSVVLTGLTPGTSYDFAVVSANSSNISNTPANFTFTTTGSAPSPIISNLAASGITATSVTITWTTDQASSSLVNYGTTIAYGSSSTLNTGLVTNHSVTLTGLALGTTYNFAVVSANAGNLPTTSTNSTFSTLSSTGPPPYVGYVAYWGVNNNGVTVSWSTDVNATAQLAYGTTPALGSLSPLQSTPSASHGVVLTGLNPGTTYYFVAQSTAANGATGYSTTYSFTTTGTAAATPPSGTQTPPAISNVAYANATSNTVTITWTTDEPSSSLVNYGTTAAYGSSSTLDASLVTSHSVTLSGLVPNTLYNYDVVSQNATGQSASSPAGSFATTPASSATPPYVGYVAFWGVSNSGVIISWSTDVPANTVVAYGTTPALGSFSPLQTGLVNSHGVTLTGLNSGTTYYFQAQSSGANGATGSSTMYSFTTTGVAATPTVISNVAIGAITSTTAVITWTTDQPSSSQVNFGTSAAYGSSTTLDPTAVTSHSVTLSGLLANTLYDLQVVSASTISGNFSFTTSAALTTTTPPTVSYVAFWGITASGVTISWSTNVPANTSVAYGTTSALGQNTPLQTAQTISHGVTLSGLNPATTYYFVAQSTDANGNTGSSTTYSFTTIAGPPTISGIVIAPTTNHSAVISWVTSAPTYSYVRFGVSSGNYGGFTAQTNLTATPSCSLGYVPSGTVYYQLVSVDANGNQVISPEGHFTEP